ncbi:MAG: hypothetical protein COA79_22995 [Planctomycetota bacterium]|nr:MAG: hypothetical protein COA79_22995 [Planctomycetota bacterium]
MSSVNILVVGDDLEMADVLHSSICDDINITAISKLDEAFTHFVNYQDYVAIVLDLNPSVVQVDDFLRNIFNLSSKQAFIVPINVNDFQYLSVLIKYEKNIFYLRKPIDFINFDLAIKSFLHNVK